MTQDFYDHIHHQINDIKSKGLYKTERILTTPQSAHITANGQSVLCLCANNYLGLANDKRLITESIHTLQDGKYGMASVRFICGTSDAHRTLEKNLSAFLGFGDTILYASCFDANGGVFESLFTKDDAIISDCLNHASLIDGIRLCKASRYRYQNNDMADLETQLKTAIKNKAKHIVIVTDGVFSMDGVIANLSKICDLADTYNALVMVDDSHAVGVIGNTGRGTHEYCKVMGRIDIMTGTFGKALGGAMGGYVSAKTEVVELLRQKSRPYLFSNSLPPSIVNATNTALQIIDTSPELLQNLHNNARIFRTEMQSAGFKLTGADHPIIPVMVGDAKVANKMAEALLKQGVYVIGFSYPVVPMGKARIRTQMNAQMTADEVKKCVQAFISVGKDIGIL